MKMARLSTHILDTALGKPAKGIVVQLFQLVGDTRTLVAERVTNADGRTDTPLLSGETIPTGIFELVFHAGAYLSTCGADLPDPLFIDVVPIRFGIADASGHYHVPLLLSPWSFSTYRGS
jgi:5-hydroxyisourate hydrolase